MTVSIYVSLLCVTCGRAIKGTICAVTVNFMLVIKILNPWLYFLRNRYFRSILKRSMKANCYRARVKPERDIYVVPTGMEEAPKMALDIHCLQRGGGTALT